MNFLIWNIRGIGNKPSQKYLHIFCRIHRIKILAIMEPNVQLDSHFFYRRLAFSQVFSNCSNKIWCFMLPSPFLLTCIYAKCDIIGRRELWDVLRYIADQNESQLWLLGGDCNTILQLNKRTGHQRSRLTSMQDFGDMIEDCGLIDAGYEGSNFTWTNHKVWKRLDRILYLDDWLNLFNTTRVSHLPRIWSNHSPLLISMNITSVKPVTSFRFLRMWARHHAFKEAVNVSWQHLTDTQGMINLQQKLYRLKQFLRWWNKNIFGDIFENIKKAEQEVANSKTKFDNDPCDSNLIELKRCTAMLTQALSIEKDYWRQKVASACRWIDEGERNIKFFHSLGKKKRCKSRIHYITHEGNNITNQEEIKKSAASYFQSLLSNDVPQLLDTELEFIQPLIHDLDNTTLCSSPELEEIKNAVFDIHPDSVAGLDSFSAFFFQHCWDIVHNDVKEAVVDFFCGNSMPRSFTATSLALIPKTESPNTWNDFRPISLCNVTNKIISKIMSNRLTHILPNIISPSQSGFVKGRLISDNILLAQELIHTINAECRYDNVVIKLDMAKAYDRIQWTFLYKVLSKPCFSKKWISLVQNYIEHCWFSVLINGSSSAFFKSSRGLRQGNPLSPSLFIIAAKFLSRGLDSLFQKHKEMSYHSNVGLRISHLAYADDFIIFTNCKKKGLKRLMNFLDYYCKASGQLINNKKSSFILNKKCSNLMIQRIQCITGFSLKHLHVTYLGAPLYKGNKKCAHFHDLICKMRSKLQGWEKSTLSHGGRLALIRSTLSTMPIFLLQVLQPPKFVLHIIEQIMAKFFWGSYGEYRRMHWTAWDTICNPIVEGGLSIRKLSDWIFHEQSSLWASFILQKYYGCIHPSVAKVTIHDSSTWNTCKVRKEVQDNMFWVLGDGHISFWLYHWSGDAPLATTLQKNSVGFGSVNFYWRNGSWNENRLKQQLLRTTAELILKTPIFGGLNDTLRWKLTSHGDFSISSAWNFSRNNKTKRQLLGTFWSPSLTPTISIFFWRLHHNWIPTDTRLQKKGFALASKCFCCGTSVESIAHLFILGEPARAVWRHFANLFNIQHPHTESPSLLLQYWNLSSPYTQSSHIRTLIPLLIFWFLWTERNDAKYRNKGFLTHRIIGKIYNHIFCLFKCRKLNRKLWRGDMEIARQLNFNFPPEKIKRPQQVSWKKPNVGWVKLNTDEAAKGQAGQAGVGGVFRDHLGYVILAFQDFIEIQNSIFAEVFALHRGLEHAKEQGMTNIWIELDAQPVIQLISSTSHGHWRLQEMLAKSKYIMSQMNVIITHTYREGNRVADFLAKDACNTQISKTFTPHQISGVLLGLIRVDQLELQSFRIS
ncbi:hypothetical protein Pfo_014423 [Paulownia fortunei]|nr:hypothetical protein Pfo_014423 [Paulownia fortunei]